VAGKHNRNDPEVRSDFQHNLEACGLTDRVTPIRGFSSEVEWKGPPIGLLFIDGDHSFRGVSADARVWIPRTAHKAVVIFDDYRKGNKGVDRVVNSVRRRDFRWEFEPKPLAIGYR
jgi:hypothetical protein